MSGPPQQLALDLAHRAALGAEDYLVSASNAAAVELIDRWPTWPHWAAVVCGPAGAGKSHLAHVWQLKSGAAIAAAVDLSDAVLAHLESRRALVVEDIDRGIASERALFHVLNLAREQKLSVLLTSRTPPGMMMVALPDLRSRLRALPLVAIEAPDEALLQGVLVKLLSDRQLTLAPRTIAYLARHMERSFEVAVRVVATADRLALERRKPLGLELVKEALFLIQGSELPD